MSKNRKRNGGMKRAYLKKTVHRYDTNPGVGFKDESQQQHNLKDAIGLGRDINPITAVPHRARLWLDKNKHTPTITEPMHEKLVKHFPGHYNLTVKEDKKEWMQTCVDNAFCTIKMFFNGFDNRAVYRFTKTDHLTGIKRESFTLTKDKALRIKESGLKGIPWK